LVWSAVSNLFFFAGMGMRSCEGLAGYCQAVYTNGTTPREKTVRGESAIIPGAGVALIWEGFLITSKILQF